MHLNFLGFISKFSLLVLIFDRRIFRQSPMDYEIISEDRIFRWITFGLCISIVLHFAHLYCPKPLLSGINNRTVVIGFCLVISWMHFMSPSYQIVEHYLCQLFPLNLIFENLFNPSNSQPKKLYFEIFSQNVVWLRICWNFYLNFSPIGRTFS